MSALADGASVEVRGSSAMYTLSRRGDVYMCTCPAWRNQGATVDRRTCKHLRAYLGDAAETARVGSPGASAGKRSAGKSSAGKPSAGKGAGKPGAAVSDGDDAPDDAPPILLAHKWEVDHDPTGWWMSEKLDGVRAYWDGEAFVSRLGKRFIAPDWFVADLPADTLDGELWVGRKQFAQTISIVRSGAAGAAWKQVRYVVFDAPNARGGFEDRIAHVTRVLARARASHAEPLAHVVCDGIDHLRAELARVEALGGEGLMLRRPGSAYEVGRSGALLKVKTFHDAEARVVGHSPGTGRHKGRLGAVIAELPDGTRFNIGTGLSDREREQPPAIGSVVTFRYQELTDDGVPRFPSWVGVRIDAEWPPQSQARPIGEVASAARGAAAAAAARPPAGGEASTAGSTPRSSAARSTPAARAAAPPTDALPARAVASPGGEIVADLVHDDAKFWRIELRGAAHYTHFGKLGSAGQTRIAEHPSADAARADAEKRAQAKRKDGYVDAS